MSFPSEVISKLKADLDGSVVSSRKQAGRALSYVESWHCIAEANRIFGFGNWDRETIDLKCINEHSEEAEGNKGKYNKHYVTYIARVRITVRNADNDNLVVREGCGSGHGKGMSDCGDAHESALKEAESDAMKRALMTFGNPFGLALYDKQQTRVSDPARQQKFIEYCNGFAADVVGDTLNQSGHAALDCVPQGEWKSFTASLTARGNGVGTIN